MRPVPAALDDRPPVLIVCAWCRHYGRPQGAVRAAGSGRWRTVSHEYAGTERAAGAASHGLCTACRRLVQQEWGLDGVPRTAEIPDDAALVPQH